MSQLLQDSSARGKSVTSRSSLPPLSWDCEPGVRILSLQSSVSPLPRDGMAGHWLEESQFGPSLSPSTWNSSAGERSDNTVNVKDHNNIVIQYQMNGP